MKLSHQQIRDLLSAKLAAADPNNYAWIRDVFDDEFAYEMGSRLYRRTYEIDEVGNATIGDPQQVIEIKSFAPANFTADGAYDDGEYRVYPNVLLFKAGDYPDKMVRVSPEDLPQMIANTAPFNLNLEHLDGGAVDALNESGVVGRAVKFWIDDKDSSIVRAEVLVNKKLDEYLEVKGISVEIPYEGPKRFTGAGLTYTPRVEQAALMAAFTSLATGQNPPAGLAGTTTTGGKPRMNLLDKLKAFFKQEGIEIDAPGDGTSPAPATKTEDIEARLNQERAAFKASVIKDKAEAFYAGLLAQKKAVPGEKDVIVARFTAALSADNPATVNFSAGEALKADGEMVKAVSELYSQRKPHSLDEEQVKTATGTALFAEKQAAPTTPQIDTKSIYNRLNGVKA